MNDSSSSASRTLVSLESVETMAGSDWVIGVSGEALGL